MITLLGRLFFIEIECNLFPLKSSGYIPASFAAFSRDASPFLNRSTANEMSEYLFCNDVNFRRDEGCGWGCFRWSGKIFQVVQILVPACGLLVQFEVPQADDIDFNFIKHVHNPFRPAFREEHA
jgi:hypothetical protein